MSMDSDIRTSLGSSLRASHVAVAVTGVGIMIRYSFYLFGAIFFAMIVYVMSYGWSARTKVVVDQDTAFRMTSNDLARFPVKTMAIDGYWAGRMEARQYGNLHDRDTDASFFLVTPRQAVAVERYFGQEILDLPRLRNSRASLTTRYYDIETRFGAVRAADLNVNSDGFIKQCIVFLTRFETNAVYMKGWLCEASGAKPSADKLACMIDRMMLDKPLASKEAEAFLRAKMAKPASCSAVPVSQTTDTRVRYGPTNSGVSAPQRWSTPNAQQRRN